MLIFRRTIVLVQRLVSSLSVGDCSVHRLRESSRNLWSERTPKECDDTKCCHHHHHHVLEGLGMLACSLILQMKLVPPSLPRSSYVSSSVWRLCRQILLPRPRRLRPRDPWAMQLRLQQTGEGAGESPAP